MPTRLRHRPIDSTVRPGRRTHLVLILVILCVWPSGLVPQCQAAPPAAPKAYIGLFKEHAVAVLDTRTHRVQATIPVPPGPHGLVITPDGSKVYVSSDGAATVSVIDTLIDKVVGSIDVGPHPHGLALSHDGHHVLVSGFGANELQLIDTTSDQITGRIAVPMPHNSVASPDGRFAYVGSQKQGEAAVAIVELATQRQVGRVALEQTPRALALSTTGQRLYVTVAGSNMVQVIDPAQGQVIGQMQVGASPHLAVLLPNGTEGLVLSQGPGTLERFTMTNMTVNQTISVGKTPHWVTVSHDGRFAYVTNEGSNDLTVVDLTKNAVLATVPVGQAPRKIALQAGTVLPQEGSTGTPSMHTQNDKQMAEHGTLDVTGKTAAEIEADDNYFAPTVLIGTPGQRLQLTLENESGTLHNFSLPEQRLDVDVPPKGTKTLEVVFPHTGSLRFFCKIHEALGMHGAFHLTGATPETGARAQ